MSLDRPKDRGPLRKLAVAVPLADAHVRRLQARFPEIEFTLLPDDAVSAEMAETDAIVAWRLSPDQLAAAPRLRWLQVASAGIDGLASPALIERGLLVTNASGVHAPNMAEHVMAMMLAFARQLPRFIRSQRDHEWQREDARDHTFELNGRTLLLVGLGHIAEALADRAAAFGMSLIAARRRPGRARPASVAEVVGLDRLPELLPRADHVAITLPLTAETDHLFDASLLSHVKPGAYLYNVGRGRVVDTDALIAALRAGRLAGAGLDVTDPEPLPPDSPLWDMENVIITAHTAGATPHYWDRLLTILEENIIRFQRGQDLLNEVDLARGY